LCLAPSAPSGVDPPLFTLSAADDHAIRAQNAHVIASATIGDLPTWPARALPPPVVNGQFSIGVRARPGHRACNNTNGATVRLMTWVCIELGAQTHTLS
jgi:hypothetical protein